MTSGCRRRSRAASCARTATASSPARRCSGTAPTSTARARCWPRRRRWASACTWRWSQGDAGRRPGDGAVAAGADGRFRPRGADFIAAWTKRSIDAGRRRARVRGAGRARPRGGYPDRPPGHTSPPRVPSRGRAARSRRSRAATASAASAARSRRRRCRGRPTRAAGIKAGVLTGLGWLTRRQLGAAPARRAELGLRRIGPPRRGARAGDHRTARPRHARAHLPSRARSSRPATTTRASWRADVGEGAARAWPARRVAVPLGGPVLSGARDTQARRRRRRRSPNPTSRRRTSIAEFTVKAVAIGVAVRRHLRRRDGLPGAQGGPDGVGVDPDRGAGDLGAQAARQVDHPREQHRADHRLGGRVDRRRRRVHPARLPVPGRDPAPARASASRTSRTGRSSRWRCWAACWAR